MAVFGFVSKKEHDKVLSEIEIIKAALPKLQSWLLQTAEAEKYNLPNPAVYENQSQLYRFLSWVFTPVNMTAQAGALTDFEVKRVVAGEELKDIPNHDFELRLRNPNPIDSRYELIYATIAYWMLNGNSYWWLNRKDENSPPSEIWVIPPQLIQPVPDKKMYLKGYLYNPGNGREILLPTHEIVHFKKYNPFSRFLGLSPIEPLALVAQGDLGMQKYNTTLFKENNGRLPGIITFQDYVDNDTWAKIKSDTQEASKNRDLMMLRGVGQSGVNWMQNSISQRDMEFLEGRKANKEEIYNTLAPGLTSMLSESATEANSIAARAMFNELTVYPLHVMMAEKITSQILPSYGGRPLVGMFEDIRVTDRQLELREQEEFSKTHTLEEVRKEYYGDDPLGDERDDLLISQIFSQNIANRQTASTPPATPPVNTPNVDVNTSTTVPAKAVYIDEIEVWERYSNKNFGTKRMHEFYTNKLPDEVFTAIKAELRGVSMKADLPMVFAKYKITDEKTEIFLLTQALNRAAKVA